MASEHPESFVQQLWSDKSWVLDRVSKRGLDLRDVPPLLKNDREVVLKAVSQDGRAVQFASEELQADGEVVQTALASDVRAFQHVAPGFRDDAALALRLIGKNPEVLKLVSPRFAADPSFALDAIASNPGAMRHVAEALRSSKEFVLMAMARNGLALSHAAPGQRGDKAVALAAVQQNGLALRFADRALHKDSEVLTHAVAQNSAVLQYVHPERIDEEVLIVAMRSEGWSSTYAGTKTELDADKMRKNPFQVAALPAMLCSLSELRVETLPLRDANQRTLDSQAKGATGIGEMVFFHAQLGLNGADCAGSLPSQATVEELGELLRDACKAGPYIHVALPDGRPLSWMDAGRLVREFVV